MASLIHASALTKTYHMGEETVRALDGVSFDIVSGDYVAIIGPSGSGKSTMMNLLGGLDTPSEGKLEIDGQNIAQMSDAELAKFRNVSIGFVFQSFNLLPRLSAWQNVELPMIYAGVPQKEREMRAKALLAQIGLGERMGHRPNQLSGGQQQRVAIARALANTPRLILADEPTGALDSHTTLEILALLRGLNQQGTTIVIVTHEHDVADQANRVIEMRDGRISSDRRPART